VGWFRRNTRELVLGEDTAPALPTGTRVIHNPTPRELDRELGFPEESEVIERHGKRFHLIQGRDRTAIEIARFVETHGHGRPKLVEDRTVYVLQAGIDLDEARRIGCALLESAGHAT
jgi:hypothetical protein